MLLPEHEPFHKLGPKEVIGSKATGEIMRIQVVRQTNTTGEQIGMECPVYADDSRDELNARLQMCYSLLQDRLEDENKALLRLSEEAKERKKKAEEEEEQKKALAHEAELKRQQELIDKKRELKAVRQGKE